MKSVKSRCKVQLQKNYVVGVLGTFGLTKTKLN
jgi:hypothetical protein